MGQKGEATPAEDPEGEAAWGADPAPRVVGHREVRSTDGRDVFTGEYRHAVDDKGRVAVPVRFRADLAAGAFVSKWIDGCLGLHPRAAWDALATRVGALPITDANARVFQRHIFGMAFEIELDRQGRLVVPAVLREFAGLEDEVVVVGSRDHLELWAPATWDAYCARMDDPELLAANLQGLGI